MIQEIIASLYIYMGPAGYEAAGIIGPKLDIFGIGTWIYGIWDKTCCSTNSLAIEQVITGSAPRAAEL